MASNGDALREWKVTDADELYGVRYWSGGYFSVSPKGEVNVSLRDGTGRSIDVSLMDIVADLRERGLGLPVLLRFSDLLDARITTVNEAFQKAIAEARYGATYRGLYPIKVNQQQQVIEEICRFGERFHHGLEAGSKAELIAGLAYLHDREALLVCNGYKDGEFVDLALSALKMGVQTVLVLEMAEELGLVLERSRALGIRPRIGIRVKLSSRGTGHWDESGGDRSAFGLNAAQVVDVVDRLRAEGMLDCLHMLHFHIGSQVSNIRNIRTAVGEAARIYADLVREGAPMGLLNVGGGLAVDYDGSQTNCPSSSNYRLDEYCADIIEAVMNILNETNVPHPVILSESGRAIVSYYSVLVFDVIGVSRFETHDLPESLPDGTHEMIRNLFEVWRGFTSKHLHECFNDAIYYRSEVRALFLHGDITLRERALAEQIFWHIVSRVARKVPTMKAVPEELEGLESSLADIYHCNFSVFQSLPDSWAIDQMFPVMPIHRLAEEPVRRGILKDLTCDSDGKIDSFVDQHDVCKSLPLHEPKPGEPYMLGVFLAGAYQETLGDLHNLLGDTNVVGIRLNATGQIEYTREIEGDTVAEILSYVEYDPKVLADRFRLLAEQAVRDGRITPQERRQILDAYQNGLRGYTYFEEREAAPPAAPPAV